MFGFKWDHNNDFSVIRRDTGSTVKKINASKGLKFCVVRLFWSCSTFYPGCPTKNQKTVGFSMESPRMMSYPEIQLIGFSFGAVSSHGRPQSQYYETTSKEHSIISKFLFLSIASKKYIAMNCLEPTYLLLLVRFKPS